MENTTGATWGTVAQRTTLTPGQQTILKALDLPEPRRFYDFTTPTTDPSPTTGHTAGV